MHLLTKGKHGLTLHPLTKVLKPHHSNLINKQLSVLRDHYQIVIAVIASLDTAQCKPAGLEELRQYNKELSK